jgi:hypothetical protein
MQLTGRSNDWKITISNSIFHLGFICSGAGRVLFLVNSGAAVSRLNQTELEQTRPIFS